jgi:predicted alpha/beta hydrolase family esterase
MFNKLFGSAKVTTPGSRMSGEALIIFVHGLGGSADGTWGEMLALLHKDSRLSHISYDCYVYPTSLFRIAMGGPRPGIRELADGLKTHLSVHHAAKKRVYLVGHSLGGLVVRRHILDTVQSSDPTKIVGALLYAVPNAGAQLATLASTLSWSHRQTIQLQPDSDMLDGLNRDWVSAAADQKANVTYVVGGADRIVSRSSGAWSQHAKIQTIIGAGHREIVKPKSSDDLAYKILYDLMANEVVQQDNAKPSTFTSSKRDSDPLFDIYTPDAEPYYLCRANDAIIEQATVSTHLWVHGKSGVGKTAALKRLACQSNWRLEHFLLSGHVSTAPAALLSAIITDLYERFQHPEITVSTTSDVEIQAHLKKIYNMVPQGVVLAILVEEIPVVDADQYQALLRHLYLAIFAAEAQSSASVIWLFSSIIDPNQYITSDLRHFRERVQLVRFTLWERNEIDQLLRKIKRFKKFKISSEEAQELIDGASGSPRVLKLVLRHRFNETGAKLPIKEVLRSIKNDLGMS